MLFPGMVQPVITVQGWDEKSSGEGITEMKREWKQVQFMESLGMVGKLVLL